MGYLTEGRPRNDQALTQSLHVPVSNKKKFNLGTLRCVENNFQT